ncbi:MAG: SpoIID/LytB domain-containing protein, partial [Chitinispirillaceae bacterium]|nr:SpoIID/LytB domain-containing protein [Chitinispirillaceae bacterium]
MAAKNRLLSLSLLAGLVSGAVSCTGIPFLVPHPPGGGAEKAGARAASAPQPASLPAAGADTIDFAAAFSIDTGVAGISPQVPWVPAQEKMPVTALPRDLLFVPGKMIRVALRRNISRAELQTSDNVEVRSRSLSGAARCSGRLLVEKRNSGAAAISVNGGAPHEVALPCTLIAVRQSNLFGLEGKRYRGSLIICGGESFSIVNLIAVEEYLRGVLPIEMGKRGMEEIEALKAQAVAARTYAYRRMVNRENGTFDVLSTIADQVYGGADIETAESDYAVNATGDLVLWWRDSLADVYYHSTCGGRTAGISEVWGGPYREYLSSRSDIAPEGQAYCSFAPGYSWEESWDAADLSKIVRASVQQVVPDSRYAGDVASITVLERFGCGRVK